MNMKRSKVCEYLVYSLAFGRVVVKAKGRGYWRRLIDMYFNGLFLFGEVFGDL